MHIMLMVLECMTEFPSGKKWSGFTGWSHDVTHFYGKLYLVLDKLKTWWLRSTTGRTFPAWG